MNLPPIIPQRVWQPPALPVRRSAMQWRRAAIFAAVLFVFALIAAIYVYPNYCTPRHSILALKAAVERRDHDGVAEYVDSQKLAESFRKYALDAYRRDSERKAPGDLIEQLFAPLGDQLVAGMVDMTFTPESMVPLLLGEDPMETLKEGFNKKVDDTVDEITKYGAPKVKAYGTAGKILLKWAAACTIDEAKKNSKSKPPEENPMDDAVTAEYESVNRYLISITPKNPDEPTVGIVFRRRGLMNWKLSEVRMIGFQKQQYDAMVKR